MITNKYKLLLPNAIFALVLLFSCPCNCMEEVEMEEVERLLDPTNLQDFLRTGGNPNIRIDTIPSNPQQPPLPLPEEAVRRNRADLILILLAHGVDPNTVCQHNNELGNTLLHCAVRMAQNNRDLFDHRVEEMAALLQREGGALVGPHGEDWGSHHGAAESFCSPLIPNRDDGDYCPTILALLRAGADLQHPNAAGYTPIDLAQGRIKTLFINLDKYRRSLQGQALAWLKAYHYRLGAQSKAHRLPQILFDYIGQLAIESIKSDTIDKTDAIDEILAITAEYSDKSLEK